MMFILENDVFKFNNNYYKQTKGIAMGTKFAPTYATLVLGFFEKQLNERIPDSLREDFVTKWKRCLDDCFHYFRHIQI